MSSVGRISLDLNINNRGFNKQVNGIQKQTTKAFGMMSVAVGNIVANMTQKAVESIGTFVKDSINKGSELSELQNVVDSVFTTMSNKVETFSQTALESYGLTETQAKKMVGTFGAMSKSFGYSEQQAYDMATALTSLAGDVSSFYNLKHDEAYTKLKSVFTGETESLKELGVVMTQTALDEFAMANGFAKTTSKMSEQEKVALRLAFVQDKLATATGDFTKTQSQWANQTRILQGQFESLQAALGQGFINVLTPVIRTLNTLMSKLVQAANVFKAFTESLMGKQSSGGVGETMKEVADAAGSAASSTGGIEDAANGAAGAAKKAQKALMGFDEINKLTKNDSSDAGASGSSGITIPTFDSSTLLAETETKLGAFAQKVIDILKPIASWVVDDAIPAFFNLLAGIFKVLDPLLESLKPSLTWLWDNFLVPIASWTGGVIVSVINAVADALDKIGTWMSNHQPVVNAITTALIAFFAAWKLTELFAFIQMSGGIVAGLTAITTALWSSIAAKLVDKAETMYLTALYAIDFVKSIAAGTKALIVNAAQWVANTAVKIAATAATVASTVATTAATAATWAFNAALAVLTSPITLVIAAVAALVAGIILLVKNFDTVKKVATDVFTAIGKVVTTAINGMLSGIETFINGVITGFNNMARALNKLKFDVPDWVPIIGGGKFGFNIKELSKVSLPRLAEGGYVKANQPQLAVVGDNKRHSEIISPEDKMLSITMKALEQFFGRLKDMGYGSSGSNEVGDIVIPIYLDGTMLDEYIVTSQQRRSLRSGGH